MHAAGTAPQLPSVDEPRCLNLRSVAWPTDSERYVQRETLLSGETGADETILRKLKPYANSTDRGLARQIATIERHAVRKLVPELLVALAKIAEVLHGSAAVSAI